MDVEASAYGGAARDQRTARSDRSRRQADHDLTGCDSQLLRSGVPDQTGRCPWTLYDGVVSRHASWNLSSVLRRVLRDHARWNGRGRGSHGTGTVPNLDDRRPDHRVTGTERGELVPTAWMLQLSPL